MLTAYPSQTMISNCITPFKSKLYVGYNLSCYYSQIILCVNWAIRQPASNNTRGTQDLKSQAPVIIMLREQAGDTTFQHHTMTTDIWTYFHA